MQYLRADSVTEVTIGPAVAVGDGFTPVTSLTIAGADEAEIIKHGATAVTAIAGTLAAITGADGYYALDLSTGETDTEGTDDFGGGESFGGGGGGFGDDFGADMEGAATAEAGAEEG